MRVPKVKLIKNTISKQKEQVHRLIDVEINEVSLVDKPAIGEEFIITKRAIKKGGTVLTKKEKKEYSDLLAKSLTKDLTAEELKRMNELESKIALSTKANSQEKSEGEQDGKDDKAGDKAEEDDSEEADAVEGDKSDGDKDEEAEKSDSEDGEDEEDGDTPEDNAENAKGKDGKKADSVDDSVEKRLTALEKRFRRTKKSLADMEAMLSQSLEFHSAAAEMLNQTVGINLAALELTMKLQSDSGVEMSEKTQKRARILTKKMKSFQELVQKAGAKISRQRLSALQEIAEKLNNLISSVTIDAKAAEGKRGGRKKGVEADSDTQSTVDSLKKEISELKKSLLDDNGTDKVTAIVEKVDGLADRLDELEESMSGSSTEIQDDDDSEDDGTSTTTKGSVFTGLGLAEGIKINKRDRLVYGDKK